MAKHTPCEATIQNILGALPGTAAAIGKAIGRMDGTVRRYLRLLHKQRKVYTSGWIEPTCVKGGSPTAIHAAGHLPDVPYIPSQYARVDRERADFTPAEDPVHAAFYGHAYDLIVAADQEPRTERRAQPSAPYWPDPKQCTLLGRRDA